MQGSTVYPYLTCFLLAVSFPADVRAQEKYPSRPIEMVVNWGTGGGADQLGRMASKMLEPTLGVALPVSNVSGASGNTGLGKVVGAQPDGYTVGTLTNYSIWAWASGMGRIRVDDLAYIGVVQSSPSMLFVLADGPIKSYKQLLEHVKAKPNTVKLATAGFGTIDDVAVKFLATKGYQLVNAPYPKAGERYVSMLGKHTDVLFEEPGDITQFLDGKQLVPIVVFGSARHSSFPDVPASAEFGHEIDLSNWRAFVTSAKVPKERLTALTAALGKMMQTDEWKRFCAQTFTCIPLMDPAASRKFAQKNYDDAAAFLKASGANFK